jgi:hypothetical protein
MSFCDLLISVMADLLASINATMTNYVNIPANATGPLDPNITLTSVGANLVSEIARLATAWSGTIARACEALI